MQIRQGRFDVSSQDGEVAQAFESAVKALFWGDVKEVLGTFEKVGKSLQVKPEQTVPLQGIGTGGQGIFTNLVAVSVGKEPSVRTSVNGVRKSFARPQHWGNPLNQVTQTNEPGTR
jgi:hypothetical protein